MRVVGQITSMTIATFFFALLLGKTQMEAADPKLFLQAQRQAFLVFAALGLAGIYFSWWRGRLDRQ